VIAAMPRHSLWLLALVLDTNDLNPEQVFHDSLLLIGAAMLSGALVLVAHLLVLILPCVFVFKRLKGEGLPAYIGLRLTDALSTLITAAMVFERSSLLIKSIC